MQRVRNQIRKVLSKIDLYLPYPVAYQLRMTRPEIELFDRTVRHSGLYLEFGSGGSTIRALQKSRAVIYSVENNSQWIHQLRHFRYIRKNENKRLNYIYVNTGVVGYWGYPQDQKEKGSFPDYSSLVFSKLSQHTPVDTVFIDGRFRVACAMKTAIYCLNSSCADVTIMIHDFWDREKYHVLLKYFDVREKAETLAVFKLKDNIDLISLSTEYNTYKFVPD